MQVKLLDEAIKNVFLDQSSYVWRVYSREELLNLKENCDGYETPDFLNNGFLRAKIGKNSIYNCSRGQRSTFSQSISSNGKSRWECFPARTTKNGPFSPSKRNIGAGSKVIPREKRPFARDCYEKIPETFVKPAWYTDGPENVDDQMDFDDMKMPQINDKAICKIECSDFSRKDTVSTLVKGVDSKSTENIKVLVQEPFANLTTSSTKNKQKPFKIFTLREIESDLLVHKRHEERICDLSAFNKLLDIVGLRSNLAQTHELGSNLSKVPLRHDNEENKKAKSQSPNQNDNSSFSETQVGTPKKYAGCATRYPTHFLNQANLGNTFRWYRAVANAASANAFIHQNIDTFNAFDAEAQRITQNTGSQVQSCSYVQNYEDFEANQCKEAIQSLDRCECISQESPYQTAMRFPVNNFVNKVANRLCNPLELHNGNKNLGRQSLQPFLLHQLLQQQQIAKYSAMHLLNLRNGGTGYASGYQSAQMNPFYYSRLTGSNTSNYHNYNQFPPNVKQQQEQSMTVQAETGDSIIGEDSLRESSTPVMDPQSADEYHSRSKEMVC